MFWETILIWGGSSTAGYGVYLWGPTIVALALGVSVPKAAAYFVFVALGGVVGKIVVTFLAPLTGRRPLGVIWGIGGVVALAAAGYYHAVLFGGVPLMVILLCASTFFIEGGFSNLAPYTVESYGVNLGARASGLGPGGKRRRQNPRAAEPGIDRRQQQHPVAASDGGRGISGLSVPCLLHGAGGAVVSDPRGRDARQDDGVCRRRSLDAFPAVRARDPGALSAEPLCRAGNSTSKASRPNAAAR